MADAGGITWVTVHGAHIPIGADGKPVGHAPSGVAEKPGKPAPIAKANSTVKEKEKTATTKSELAKQSAKHVGADIQRYSEEHNEPILAKAIKGTSLRDNEPIDVLVLRHGRVAHGVELKTMVDNKSNKITMKTSAMERKAAWMNEHNAPMHTVIFDDHKAFNANGPGKHDDSKRQIYYRRGFGSFRVSGMHPVKDMDELNRLLDTPDHELPKAAQPGANYPKLKATE